MADRDLSALRIDPADKRERPRRWLLPLIIVAAGLAAAAGGWWLVAGPAVVEVRTALVEAAGADGPAAVLNASGYVTPRRRATVSSKITGRLIEVRIEEGVEVEANEVLARLDDVDERAALRAAEAEIEVAVAARRELDVELADATRSLGRIRALQADEVVSQDALDQAETRVEAASTALDRAAAQIESARAQVEVTRRNIANCVIRAPFAGIVVSKDAQPGEMVSPVSAGGGFTRTGIATVVDMASLEIEVDVNEAYISRVTPGQRIEAVLDAYPDWKIPASVITVIPTADRQKATVQVRIGFDRLDPRILPDMGVRVTFLDREASDTADKDTADTDTADTDTADKGEVDADDASEAGQAPVARVPATAVIERDGTQIVLVVQQGKARRRAVRCGLKGDGTLEILAGLRAGERVILSPPGSLRDGDAVQVVDGDSGS